MARRDRLSGNEAVAEALRQINPDVFPAFPITPVHRDSAVFCLLRGKWEGRYRVYSRRKRAQFHERGHRRVGRRRPGR